MHKLGISVYPEHSSPDKDYEYMKLAASYGFSRIFTCLLSVSKPKETMLREFTEFIRLAHGCGYEVAADTNPEGFRHLGAAPENLKIFAEMGLDIIRLDGSFGGPEDRLITRNPYGIRIEYNASSDLDIGNMIRHGADPRRMMMCHNFYPQRYTGLSWESFKGFNEKWNGLGLRTAAFVSSRGSHTWGPWPVSAGLPTMEADRELPIGLQLRHLLSTGMIDDILIGNAYASEEELKAMSETDMTNTVISMNPVDHLSHEELRVIRDFHHSGRTDASAYFIRSCCPRSSCQDTSIPARGCQDTSIPARGCQTPMFRRGDVAVVNDNLAHYRGEVEIILRDMPSDGERNLVGRIPEEEFLILERMEEHPDYFWDFSLR